MSGKLPRRIRILAELRHPSTLPTKLLSIFLALALLVAVATSTISGLLLYQLFQPALHASSVNLDLMMGHPGTFSFDIPGRGSREGWFFPGHRGAPTIILCHGYETQRMDFLTLVTSLQDQQFNVFLFDFAGHGAVPGRTSFGYAETRELLAAINAVARRTDVDQRRFGVWGVDMGGYVALEAAAADARIAAVAVDSVYNDPHDMVRNRVNQSGLSNFPFVLEVSEFGFNLLNYPYRHEPPLVTKLVRLRPIPKLFIISGDRPALAESTDELFLAAPEPRKQQRDRLSYAEMGDDDRRAYEAVLFSFFLQSLPLAAR